MKRHFRRRSNRLKQQTLRGSKSIWKQLRLPSGGSLLITDMAKGFDYQVIDRLAQFSGLEKRKVAEFANISPSTLIRRAGQGKFNAEESDRLWRMARLFELATELFEGDDQAAQEWINEPAHGLDGRAPIEMIGTSLEFETVSTLIERLEHGVVA
ncbi:MAG: antitoxin Xre/MbcA/ParS toxin-binding domain-containing protein [Pseudohongiellaceae bacterium]